MAALNTLSVVGPNYSYIFDFERDFEHTEAKAWMVANWRTVCFYSGGLYLLLVFAGQQVSLGGVGRGQFYTTHP
jgi:hypothetical protein